MRFICISSFNVKIRGNAWFIILGVELEEHWTPSTSQQNKALPLGETQTIATKKFLRAASCEKNESGCVAQCTKGMR